MYIDWNGKEPAVTYHNQTLLVKNIFRNICTGDNGVVTDSPVVQRFDLRGTPFIFSIDRNVFAVKGCGASLILKNRSNKIVTGCSSICTNNVSKKDMTNCNGDGCCQSRLSSSTYDLETKKDKNCGWKN
uniref:Uncharacterized protein n=1 Tax=Chenopodium quinoa TaxID=63459 RepID=A0A803L9B6_CHEQI